MTSISALKKAKSAQIPVMWTPPAADCHSTNGGHLGQLVSTVLVEMETGKPGHLKVCCARLGGTATGEEGKISSQACCS